MTRVLFCSQAAHTGGGIEHWQQSLALGLIQRGHEVTIGLARGRQYHDPAKFQQVHPFPTVIEIDGIHGYRETRTASLLSVFEKISPQIVIPAALVDAMYAAALWKKNNSNVRLVVCTHAQHDKSIVDIVRCSNAIDAVVSVSRRGVEELKSASIPEFLIHHIPTGVVPPSRPPQRCSVSKELHLGYIGRIDQLEKRVFDLIDVVSRLRDHAISWHIVGDGVDASTLRNALQATNGKVQFYGALSREELYKKIYPMLHGLLVFSAAEGGPIVAWEAMRHGVVPVVSDFIGRSDEGVLEHDNNALVFPVGDTQQAAACVLMLQKENTYSKLSSNAMRLPGRYQYEGFIDAWENLINAALASPVHISYALPSMISSGRLARLGLGVRTMAKLRKLMSKPFVHSDAGGEWPHYYASSARE